MKKLFYILLFTVLISSVSCKKMNLCEDKELALNRTEYAGYDLRIDGFYFGNPRIDSQGRNLYELMVF